MKKLILIAALCLTPLTARATNWICALNSVSNALTKCQDKIAGSRLFITDIVVSSSTTTGGTFYLTSGIGANCGTNGAKLYPPVATAAIGYPASNGGGARNLTFRTPIEVPAGQDICVFGTATNTANIAIHGYAQP